MALLSIIVPIYNSVDKGLEQCLKSILSQTFTHYELILVNDGSTDASLEVCRTYEQADSRIHIIDQPNRGVSAARNSGIDAAHGEYLTFIDSDDVIVADYLGSLMKYSHDADLVVCGVKQEFPDGCEKLFNAPEGYHKLSDTEAFHNLIKSRLVFGPCNKLFNTNIVYTFKIRFPEGVDYGEDRLFCYEYLMCASDYLGVQGVYYSYLVQPGNSLSTIYRKNLFSLEYSQWRRLYELYGTKGNLIENTRRDLMLELFWMVNDAVAELSRHKIMTRENLRKILSVPEIDEIKPYAKDINHNRFLKRMILKRESTGIMYFYKMLGLCRK